MTGFRLGYACGPASLIGTMMKIHQYGIMSAPTLSQAAGVEAMDNGDVDVSRMRAEYKRRRDFLVTALNKMDLKTILPKGAFYVFADISNTGLEDEDFCLKLLDQYDVACVPGSAFGACGKGFIRMSYATSLDKIRIAAERLSMFLRNLKK
jgi:aminotransferase